MKIAVIGTGYVGLVSAACFAELGHTVMGVDIDPAKVELLKQGKSPIFEPGLEELIKKGLRSKLLSFTTDITQVLPSVQVLFSAVATPQGENHQADLRAVFSVCDAVAKHIDHDLVFVNKSTVPVGTGLKCQDRIREILRSRGVPHTVSVISNPEFLREGMAVGDTLMPDRIVVGLNGSAPLATSSDQGTRKIMEELYRPITRVGKPIIFMSRESAEIVKYASNAFLATKISFINMLTELCEKTGADIRDIATGMGLDDRIGPRFLHAGIGYGGSCFPKDVKALMATAREHNLDFAIVEATDHINARQRARFFGKILASLAPRSTVAVWGLSFKPKTDDMREAPSLDLIPMLLDAGHSVRAFDPEAMERAKPLLPPGVAYTASSMEAVKDADATVLLTEWDVFRGADLGEMKKAMKGDQLWDGRNIYEPALAKLAGLQHHGIGLGKA